jgi:hypothetical protein
MFKRHTVTLHHVIAVYDYMYDDMDCMMRGLAKTKTQWKEHLFLAVKLPWHKLSKYFAEVTPTKGMRHISAHILHPVRKLRSFRKWDKGMEIKPEDEISYIIQYPEAFLMYVQTNYCATHQRLPANKLVTV